MTAELSWRVLLDSPLVRRKGLPITNAARALGFAILASVATGCKADQAAPEDFSREKLVDPETCNLCHQDHYREWLGSMHAYSSRDPLFLAMNKRGQEETQGKLGNFCVNCHAPMAAHELGGNGDTIDPATIPARLQGVTCYFCHNVTEVQGNHNNPLVVADDTTMRGGFGKPQPIGHQAAYSPLHDSLKPESASLCGGCHDIVVPAHFSGAAIDLDAGVSAEGVKLEQTYAEWRSSIFVAGPGSSTCGGCHLQSAGSQPIANPPPPHPLMTPRIRHLHDFPAVDTAFFAPGFPDTGVDAGVRDAQERRVTDALDRELLITTCVDQLSGEVVVTLENLVAGHNFPSGASQDRRLWIELHVFEKQTQPDGSKLDVDAYQSGVVPAGQSVVQAQEDAVARGDRFNLFRDETTKKDGSVAHMFWDVAKIKTGTIPVATSLFPNGNRAAGRYPEVVTHVRQPSRVTVKVWLEPVGIDVIDDLIKSGHILDGDAMPSLRDAMPRRLLSPPRLFHPDTPPDQLVTFDWHVEDAVKALGSNGDACLSSQ